MIDDVQLSVMGRVPVVGIGEISSDPAGFGMGPLLDPNAVRERVESALREQEVAR
jgi:hypothetical protein